MWPEVVQPRVNTASTRPTALLQPSLLRFSVSGVNADTAVLALSRVPCSTCSHRMLDLTQVTYAEYQPCTAADTSGCPEVRQWLDEYFGFKFGFRWWCVAILMAFIVFFRVAAMIALKFVNHQHK
jgi:hypothetical protein